MTLSSQKLNQVGSIFLLVLFLLCELSGHTILHCTCLDSAYQYHGETIISKFTIIKKSPQNTEIVQCGDTQELFLSPNYYKTTPYSYFYLLHNSRSELFLLCYTLHKSTRKEIHYFREFTSEFKAKRTREEKKDNT